MKKLTVDDITETTGNDDLNSIRELEILFLPFNEIDSLGICSKLQKLTCINNCITRISNLVPVSNLLVSLCLCDQQINFIENLELPFLEELFLHRNQITKMSGLEKCPRLRKLWLFQNYIPSISGIQQCPELIELMLQNNHVEYLTGLEHNHKIETLNLAGNPVSDIYETKRLSSLQHLSNLSFCDVHFGKCPIFDEDGYNEFIILNLRQIQNLDGVIISEAKINVAENTIIQRVIYLYEPRFIF
jgi:Leucine-rich repeat (LRR) protein